MKFQDSSFNGLKVTVGTKSVTHPPTHPPTHAPKAICPINFFKVGGIKIESLFFNLHDVMKTVVIAKILHEAQRASWNFSSTHCLHHIIKVKK